MKALASPLWDCSGKSVRPAKCKTYRGNVPVKNRTLQNDDSTEVLRKEERESENFRQREE
jgi:hypothetical protein